MLLHEIEYFHLRLICLIIGEALFFIADPERQMVWVFSKLVGSQVLENHA